MVPRYTRVVYSLHNGLKSLPPGPVRLSLTLPHPPNKPMHLNLVGTARGHRCIGEQSRRRMRWLKLAKKRSDSVISVIFGCDYYYNYNTNHIHSQITGFFLCKFFFKNSLPTSRNSTSKLLQWISNAVLPT